MAVLAFLPEWLTNEKYLTLATWGLVAATIVLGLATLLLYLDGRAKSQEQRERWAKEDREGQQGHAELLEKWRRDDQVQTEQTKPHYMWGFNHAPGSGKVKIWVANLGSTSFLLTSIWVERQDPLNRTPIDPRPVPFVVTEVVATGMRTSFDVSREFQLPRNFPTGGQGEMTLRYEVWCTIESPTETRQTSRKAIIITLSPENHVVSSSEDAIQKLNPSLAAPLR
jgi:hypothetical protein